MRQHTQSASVTQHIRNVDKFAHMRILSRLLSIVSVKRFCARSSSPQSVTRASFSHSLSLSQIIRKKTTPHTVSRIVLPMCHSLRPHARSVCCFFFWFFCDCFSNGVGKLEYHNTQLIEFSAIQTVVAEVRIWNSHQVNFATEYNSLVFCIFLFWNTDRAVRARIQLANSFKEFSSFFCWLFSYFFRFSGNKLIRGKKSAVWINNTKKLIISFELNWFES